MEVLQAELQGLLSTQSTSGFRLLNNYYAPAAACYRPQKAMLQSSRQPPFTLSAAAGAATASINDETVSKPTKDVIVGLKTDG